MRTRPTAAAALVAGLFALTGCGGDGGDAGNGRPASAPVGPAAGSATPAASAAFPGRTELEEAVRAYTKAYFSGRGGEAYALLSARCKELISVTELSALSEQARQQWAFTIPVSLTIDHLEGGTARVSYTFVVQALDQTSEPWVAEDGQWRQDDC